MYATSAVYAQGTSAGYAQKAKMEKPPCEAAAYVQILRVFINISGVIPDIALFEQEFHFCAEGLRLDYSLFIRKLHASKTTSSRSRSSRCPL